MFPTLSPDDLRDFITEARKARLELCAAVASGNLTHQCGDDVIHTMNANLETLFAMTCPEGSA